jgi:hypothetical protein
VRAKGLQHLDVTTVQSVDPTNDIGPAGRNRLSQVVGLRERGHCPADVAARDLIRAAIDRSSHRRRGSDLVDQELASAARSASGMDRLYRSRNGTTVVMAADQLAARLLHPSSMAGACGLLTLPQLQAWEAAAALGDGCTTARLATLLGVPEADPDLAAALRRLTQLAVIWPHADGFVVSHLSAVWPHPLNLGPGAAELLTTQNMNELRRLAKLYGVPFTGLGKDEVIAVLAGWLAQPENVRRLAAQAPADVRAQLGRLALRPASPFGLGGIMLGAPGMTQPVGSVCGFVLSRRDRGRGQEQP